MVNKTLIAVSYCCSLILVFLSYIAYTIFPIFMKQSFGKDVQLPAQVNVNVTNQMLSMTSHLGTVPNVFGILIVIIVAMAILSFGTMRGGMNG